MEIKRGIAVSPGVAIGPALVLDTEGFRIPRRTIGTADRDAEVHRLRQGLAQAAAEARSHQATVTAQLGLQYGAIFGAHALMIEDPVLGKEIEALIRDQGFSAEYAFSRVMRHYAKTLQHWSQRLEAHLDAARASAGDKRLRIWRIYLAGCAHAFERNWVTIQQVVATKSENPSHNPLPWTREHLYR